MRNKNTVLKKQKRNNKYFLPESAAVHGSLFLSKKRNIKRKIITFHHAEKVVNEAYTFRDLNAAG